MTSNVKHSSMSQEFYTPINVAEPARKTMGGIDLDPASCDTANRIIKADWIYTKENDGLCRPWIYVDRPSKVFLNPPGGKTNGKSNMAIWFDHLYDLWVSGDVEQAVFLAFQPSILRLCPQIVEDSLPFVVPRKRLAFWQTKGTLVQTAKEKDDKRNKRLDFPEQVEMNKLLRHLDRQQDDLNFSGYPDQDDCLYPTMSPSHDNLIIYMPPKFTTHSYFAEEEYTTRFYRNFASLAAVPSQYQLT